MKLKELLDVLFFDYADILVDGDLLRIYMDFKFADNYKDICDREVINCSILQRNERGNVIIEL